MFETTNLRPPAASASAFVAATEAQGSGSDIWTDAGRAIELAYCHPSPISQVMRISVVVALGVAAKLYSAGALR